MKRSLWWVMVCCLLAFGLRVSGAADYPLDALHDDHKDYHTMAANLISGAGYVQVDGFAYGRQPGWPFLLAGAYAIGGVNTAVGIVLNAMLAALTVAVTYRVGRIIGDQTRRRGVGEVAALLVAVDPFLIVLDQTLLSETLYTLGMMAALWALLRQRSATFGVLVALMALVRANGIVLLVAALLFPRRMWWRAGLAALLVLIPWGIRNAFVIGSPSPLAPQTGQLLLGSYNDFTLNSPEAYGMWLFPVEIPEGEPYADLPYLEREQAWASEARTFIANHIADVPVMMFR
ncbi:MAG: hypothetical protein H7175_07125, partial [Burkholderiales bacterium]|nr:hypothetical protein [Anaerolineae bacterium]